jgi:hypothetical protein
MRDERGLITQPASLKLPLQGIPDQTDLQLAPQWIGLAEVYSSIAGQGETHPDAYLLEI